MPHGYAYVVQPYGDHGSEYAPEFCTDLQLALQIAETLYGEGFATEIIVWHCKPETMEANTAIDYVARFHK